MRRDPLGEIGADLGIGRATPPPAVDELIGLRECLGAVRGDHHQLAEAVDFAPTLARRPFLPEQHAGQDQVDFAEGQVAETFIILPRRDPLADQLLPVVSFGAPPAGFPALSPFPAAGFSSGKANRIASPMALPAAVMPLASSTLPASRMVVPS